MTRWIEYVGLFGFPLAFAILLFAEGCLWGVVALLLVTALWVGVGFMTPGIFR